MQNIVYPEREKSEWYTVEFWYDEDGGFSFPCDETGKPLFDDTTDVAKENYEWCMAHPEKFVRFNEVRHHVSHYKPNAHGTCVCGAEVELYDQYMGACECPNCGRWYNLFGQSLVPPNQWSQWENMDDRY